VLQRPNDEPAGIATMCPGLHRFAAGGYSVVWWDPGTGSGLALGAKPPFGVRREELIVKDVARNVIAEGRTRYDRWCLARSDAREAGEVPSIKLETVREWTADESHLMVPDADPAAVQVLNLTRGAKSGDERPGGAAFGVLVHAVLAQASFDASRTDLENIAMMEARILGLTDEDAKATLPVVERLFAHDILARARAAAARGDCRRETPVTCLLADGTMVEGVVDLAFQELGQWCVVDYKTDRELAAAGEARYRRQVALYAAAIQRATGTPATGVLIRL
jgi:ATP-dependent exoDNAse (exonuclease V) beta subunit